MFEADNVLLRPAVVQDAVIQRHYFANPELAGLDCHAPHEYVKIDAEALLGLSPDKRGDATFAIEAEGEYVGYCGLMNLDNPRGIYELGVNIGNPDCWNRGYGREAVALLLHYGFHYLPGRRIELTTHERNPRAISCYASCGFVEEGRLRRSIWIEGEYIDLVLMAVLREEWQPAF